MARPPKSVDNGWANYDLPMHCAPGTVDALWQEFRDAGVPMRDYFDTGPVNRSYGIRDFSIYNADCYDLVFGAEI